MLPSQTRSDSFRVTDEPPASVPVMETESSSPGHHATKRPSATLAVTVRPDTVWMVTAVVPGPELPMTTVGGPQSVPVSWSGDPGGHPEPAEMACTWSRPSVRPTKHWKSVSPSVQTNAAPPGPRWSWTKRVSVRPASPGQIRIAAARKLGSGAVGSAVQPMESGPAAGAGEPAGAAVSSGAWLVQPTGPSSAQPLTTLATTSAPATTVSRRIRDITSRPSLRPSPTEPQPRASKSLP